MQWRHNQALIEQKDEARKLDYFLEKTKESLVLNAYFLPDFRWSRAPLSCCNSLAYTDICIRLESIHVLIQICTEKSIKIKYLQLLFCIENDAKNFIEFLPDLFLDDICESHWSWKFDYVFLLLVFFFFQLRLQMHLHCIDRCQSRSHWHQMIRNQSTWKYFLIYIVFQGKKFNLLVLLWWNWGDVG